MLAFDETYKMMGVSFDKIYYETEILIWKERKRSWKDWKKVSSSAKRITRFGLISPPRPRPETVTPFRRYFCLHDTRYRYCRTSVSRDFPIDKMIYVVGNKPNYHFQVLSILFDQFGFKWGKDLVHFSYGMVELPNGKMKSREGTVVDADDLMQR